MLKKIAKFLCEKSGNVALSAALMSVPLFGAGGVAVDYAVMFQKSSELQEAVDAAALASVKELSLAGADSAKIQSIAESYVATTLYPETGELANQGSSVSVSAQVFKQEGEVKVDIEYMWKPFLAHMFDSQILPIKATATAKLAGDALTCVVGLMEPQTLAKASIHIDNKSKISAEDCAVYSNSHSQAGLRGDSKAQMHAGSICSAGGVITYGNADFSPDPILDCPKISDPLADRSKPSFGGCNHNGLVVASNSTLKPGVYCGGLTLSGSAKVSLEPGIYVIKDGPFIVTDTASLVAKKVGFFLTGKGSIFEFHADTTIDLEAMETGSMAGLLFHEDRAVPHSFEFNPFAQSMKFSENVRVHKVSSNDARNLLGTLYLSRSILLIDSNAPVADVSSYTAIVTGRLWLREGPTLTLNANLTDTSVPVPEGILGTTPILID